MPISKTGNVTVINNITTSVGDHQELTNRGTVDAHSQYLLTSSYQTFSSSVATHVDDTTIHFTEASIDHGSISGLGDAADHPWAATTSSLATLSSSVATHIDDTTIHFTSASIVHNDLSGLTSGDPHTQYILVDGTRAFTGDVSLGGNNINTIGFLTATGVTGAHSEVSSGVPFILAIGGVSATTGANGQITLSSSIAPTDHGLLTGLEDNDHPQYLLTSSFNVFSTSVASHVDDATIHFTEASIDHGSISGLGDNDHPQYLLTSSYNVFSTSVAAHVDDTTIHFTEASIDHGSILGLGDDDHPQYLLTSSFNVFSTSVAAHVDDAVIHSTSSADVTMAFLSGARYKSVQAVQDSFHSAGKWASGSITDIGGGMIHVNSGTGFTRLVDDIEGTLYFADWPAFSASIPTNSASWVGLTVNNGQLSGVLRDSNDFNYQTEFSLGTVVNEGGTLHIANIATQLGDHASLMIRRGSQTMPYARDATIGGLIVGETGTRNPTLSAGAMWQNLERFAISAIDTSAAGTFDAYYRDGSGGWTVSSSMKQYPNDLYDDGTGTLATLSTNNFLNHWWYLDLAGNLMMVWGQGNHNTLAAAEAESVPTPLPTRITVQARLLGRTIVQKNGTTYSANESVFDAGLFSVSSITDHGNLSGLGDNDHPQYLLTSSFNTVSTSIATDIRYQTRPSSSVSTGINRTLVAADNGTVIYMSGSSQNILRVPADLFDGFHVVAVQASAYNIQVVATASLTYPTITFTSRSLEQGASIAIFSGSNRLVLGGTLEAV